MGTEISRNSPCPCGSGKKYKNCCLNKPLLNKKTMSVSGLLVVIAVVAGVATGYYYDWETGIAAGVGILLIAGIIMAFFNPPPAGGKGDAGAINFGS